MSYKKLGEYIQPVNNRNTDLKVKTLLGVSIRKVLMPSIANTIGTNMKTYKIIEKNQFAYGPVTSRNGDKISIALLEEHEIAIVSQAYTVFEVIDKQEVLPEYLMMWFRRPEFDRFARFKSHGSAREVFDWEELCDTQLPIPSIEKQRQIVAEYNTVTNRIKLNEQLNQKLEETAQALYKHWFVDFEFPVNLARNPNPSLQGTKQPAHRHPELVSGSHPKGYKSSGGKMVYNEELDKDIPVGWSVKGLSSIADYLNGAAMQKFPSNSNNNYTPVLKIRELNIGKTDGNSDKAAIDIPEKYKMQNGDVIFSWSGTLAIDIWTGGYAGLNQHLFKVSSDDFPKWYYYLSTKLYIEEFKRIADGNKTSMGHIKREHLDNSFISYPNENFNSFNAIFEPLISKVESNKLETQTLKELQSLLLAKMTQQETKAQVV